MKKITLFFFALCLLAGCKTIGQVSQSVSNKLFADSVINSGFIGIAVYDTKNEKFLFEHNSTKYFTPASNLKLFSMYFAMKYLKDSVPGMYVQETADSTIIFPAGDPTLLHPWYKSQPVMDYLSKTQKPIAAHYGNFRTSAWGSGWSWSDYDESYMNERSDIPVFGNNVVFSGNINQMQYYPLAAVTSLQKVAGPSKVSRELHSNDFKLSLNEKRNEFVVPFITSPTLNFKILSDTLHKPIVGSAAKMNGNVETIFSRHLDSVLVPMMHESDNFFAEQCLLMVSNKLLGYFSTTDVIRQLIKNDLKEMPQTPQWADGSGLSRYNQISPKDFVWLLKQMKEEQPWERITAILPTGGTGTLKNYYKGIPNKIFAKTGSLSNVICLSGYLITEKNNTLIFSVLTNNAVGSGTAIRRAVQKFITQLQKDN